MTAPVPGWYPDPSGRPGERWWNGATWSDDTRPPTAAPGAAPTYGPTSAPAAAPATGDPRFAEPAVPADAPYGWDGFGNPAPPREPAPGPGYATTPPPTYAPRPGGPSRSPATFLSRNGFSLGTVGVAVLYLLILVFAHFAILGVLPIFLGIRAVNRKEPLAWVAIAIAVVALVVGLTQFIR